MEKGAERRRIMGRERRADIRSLAFDQIKSQYKVTRAKQGGRVTK